MSPPAVVGGPEARDRLLEAIYDLAGGALMQPVDYNEAGRRAGLSPEDVDAAISYLIRRRLVDGTTMGGGTGLSTIGIDRVERLRERRARRSKPAPTVGSIIVITHAERAQIEAAVGELDRLDASAELVGDDRSEYDAERDTVTAQLRSPRPKRSILRAALSRLGDLVTQTSAGYLAAKLHGLL